MKGKYVEVKLSEESKNYIESLGYLYDIPMLISKEDYHITVIYSKNKPMTGLELDEEIIEYCEIIGFNKFDDDLLVLLVKSEYLENKHKELMDNYDGEYDFDEYIPHITLSYDAGKFNKKLENNFKQNLILNQIVSSELEEDYVPEIVKEEMIVKIM